MSDFETWWNENKDGVLFDAYAHLPLKRDEATDARLQHIALQAFVAARGIFEPEPQTVKLPIGKTTTLEVPSIGLSLAVEVGRVNQGHGHGYYCLKLTAPEGESVSVQGAEWTGTHKEALVTTFPSPPQPEGT